MLISSPLRSAIGGARVALPPQPLSLQPRLTHAVRRLSRPQIDTPHRPAGLWQVRRLALCCLGAPRGLISLNPAPPRHMCRSQSCSGAHAWPRGQEAAAAAAAAARAAAAALRLAAMPCSRRSPRRCTASGCSWESCCCCSCWWMPAFPATGAASAPSPPNRRRRCGRWVHAATACLVGVEHAVVRRCGRRSSKQSLLRTATAHS